MQTITDNSGKNHYYKKSILSEKEKPKTAKFFEVVQPKCSKIFYLIYKTPAEVKYALKRYKEGCEPITELFKKPYSIKND